MIWRGREAASHPLDLGRALNDPDESVEQPGPNQVRPLRRKDSVDPAEGPGAGKPHDLFNELAALPLGRVEVKLTTDKPQLASDRVPVTAEGTLAAAAVGMRLTHDGTPYGGVGQEA